MIVDSSAIVAIILGETDEPMLSEAILMAAAPRISAAAYLEISLRIDTPQRGSDPALDATLDHLGISIAAFTPEQARVARAAQNRFGRGRHPARLNFGDCMTYALAKTTGEPLLFKGNDFIHTDLIPALAPGGATDHDYP